MSDSAHAAKLKDALRTGRTRFTAVRAQWSDAQSQRLEQEVLGRAEEAVRLAILAMDQLGEAIGRARAECSEGPGA